MGIWKGVFEGGAGVTLLSSFFDLFVSVRVRLFTCVRACERSCGNVSTSVCLSMSLEMWFVVFFLFVFPFGLFPTKRNAKAV